MADEWGDEHIIKGTNKTIQEETPGWGDEHELNKGELPKKDQTLEEWRALHPKTELAGRMLNGLFGLDRDKYSNFMRVTPDKYEEYQKKEAGFGNAAIRGIPIARQMMPKNKFQDQWENKYDVLTPIARTVGGIGATLPLFAATGPAAGAGLGTQLAHSMGLTGMMGMGDKLAEKGRNVTSEELLTAGASDAALGALGPLASKAISPALNYTPLGGNDGKVLGRIIKSFQGNESKMIPEFKSLMNTMDTRPARDKIIDALMENGGKSFKNAGVLGGLSMLMGAHPAISGAAATIGAMHPFLPSIKGAIPSVLNNTKLQSPNARAMINSLLGTYGVNNNPVRLAD